MEKFAAIILINKEGKPYGAEKSLIKINEKSAIEYVLEAIPDYVTEIVISLKDEKYLEDISNISEKYFAEVIIDDSSIDSPLISIINCFKKISSISSIVLKCNLPLLTMDFLNFLLEASTKFNAVIPRWPNEKTEFLCASYRIKPFLEASEKSLANKDYSMNNVVKNMRNVLYILTSALKNFDEELLLFKEASTINDAKKIENLIKKKYSFKLD
ncbi:MAG: NTP transferase domain-containing protein [Nitrososphaerota archaeon]